MIERKWSHFFKSTFSKTGSKTSHLTPKISFLPWGKNVLKLCVYFDGWWIVDVVVVVVVGVPVIEPVAVTVVVVFTAHFVPVVVVVVTVVKAAKADFVVAVTCCSDSCSYSRRRNYYICSTRRDTHSCWYHGNLCGSCCICWSVVGDATDVSVSVVVAIYSVVPSPVIDVAVGLVF